MPRFKNHDCIRNALVLFALSLALGGCPEQGQGPKDPDACETGELDCPCNGNATCNAGLQCVQDVCLRLEEPTDVITSDLFQDLTEDIEETDTMVADTAQDIPVEADADIHESDRPPLPVDVRCGTNAGDHFRDSHTWPGAFCAAEILQGDPPSMPEPRATAQWSCGGEHGGASLACSATRLDACSPSRRPPPGWTQITNNCDPQHFAESCVKWGPKGIWPLGFPGGSGNTRRLASGFGQIPQYLAIEIRTFEQLAVGRGRITMEHAGSYLSAAPRHIMTISSCPGDFNQDAIMADTGCYGSFSPLMPLRWRGPDATETTPPTNCVLQPNRTYFWNIIPTISPLGTAPDELEIDPVCLEGVGCGLLYSPGSPYPSTADIWSEICDPDVDYGWTTCP